MVISKLLWLRFFHELAHSDEFIESVWEKTPKLWTGIASKATIPSPLAELRKSAREGLLQHGDQTYMAFGRDSSFKGDSSPYQQGGSPGIDEASLEQSLAMTDGTVVVNHAHMLFNFVAEFALAASSAFGFTTAVNMYTTLCGPQSRQSIAPHNDRKDVFVVQLTGSKQWTLIEPHVPLPLPTQERGKHKVTGAMPRHEVDPALNNVTIVTTRAGDVLYLPRGYVHGTKTSADCDEGEYSVHATLGLQTDMPTYTHVGLCMLALSHEAFAHAKADRDISWAGQTLHKTALNTPEFRRVLPFGFLSRRVPERETEALIVKEMNYLLKTHTAGIWPQLHTYWTSRDPHLQSRVVEWFRQNNQQFQAKVSEKMALILQGKQSAKEKLKLDKYFGKVANLHMMHQMEKYCGIQLGA